jgi:hypothetical protein
MSAGERGERSKTQTELARAHVLGSPYETAAHPFLSSQLGNPTTLTRQANRLT